MGPGRPYVVTWDAATAVTTAIDIFWIKPAADKPVFVDELTIWQTSDFGDAQDEVLQIQLVAGQTTVGSGGSASPLVGRPNASDTAASFTARCRDTTIATAGTPYIVHADAWNVRAPYIWTPPDPKWIQYGTNALPLVVRLPAAPADSLTMNAQVKVREIG